MARINIHEVAIQSKHLSGMDSVRIIMCPYGSSDIADIHSVIENIEINVAVFNYSLKDIQKYLVNSDMTFKFSVNIVMDFEVLLDMHIFTKSQSSNDNVYTYLDSCSIKNIGVENGTENSTKRLFTIKFDIENEGYKFQILKMTCLKVTVPFTKVFISFIPDGNYDKAKIFYKEDKNFYYIPVIEFTGKDKVLMDFDKKINVFVGLFYNDNLGYKELFAGTFTPNDSTYGSFKLYAEDVEYDIEYKISEIQSQEKITRTKFSWELSTPIRLNLKYFSNKIKNADKKLAEILDKVKPQETAQPKPDNNVSPQLNTDINPLNGEDHKRINKFITEYYQEFLSNPILQDKYIQELTHSQYPVMAYPVYPEPAYYYLKQISERFILPASGSMPDNSMALFVNNAAFVEAFLCGMNTEMGRELLWREYPTDSRGSYFRKFWDTEIKKDIKEELRSDTFFDILPIHKWEYQPGDVAYIPFKSHKLGQNHSPGKDNLLIFAIKGELLKKYPETIIYLSKASLSGNKIILNPDAEKILPDLSAWLSEDTYIVGFPAKLDELAGNPSKRDPGYFLTFMNRPGETRFASSKDNPEETASNAAETAANLLVQPSMFGKHISQFLSGWQNAPQK